MYLGSASLTLVPIPASGNPGDVLTKDTAAWFPISWQPGGGGGGGAPTNAPYVVVSLDPTLTADRALAVEAGVLALTDGGANSNITISVATNGLPFAKIQQIATNSFVGRITAGTGDFEVLTGTQATTLLDAFTAILKGTAPASGGGTTNFLRADGLWAVPPGSGSGAPTNATYVTLSTDATLTNERTLAGEASIISITDNGAGNTVEIGLATNGVTNTKIRQSAALSLIGRSANSLGNVADIAAAADDTVMRRTGSTLSFGQLTVGMAPNSVWTYAKLQDVSATSRFLGRVSVGAGVIEELTNAQAKTILAITASDVSGLAAIATSGSGGDLTGSSVTNAKLSTMAAATIKGNNTGGATNPIDLTAAQVKTLLAIAAGDVSGLATIATTGSGGDLTASSVTNAKLSTMASLTLKGNNTGGAANPSDLTPTQVTAMLDAFTTLLKGLVPASGGGTLNYLRADGTWNAPPGSGGGISDGDYGDIVVSVGGTVWTIDAGVVTLTKMANLAANSIIGNNTGAGATPIALTPAQVKTLLAIAAGDVSGLAATATSTNAANLTGTLAAAQLPAMTGDVTAAAGTHATAIAINVVSNTKLAQVATATFKGRVTAATGNVEDLTGTQATTLLDAFTSALKGLVPPSGGGTTNFLRADGSWAAPGGGGGVSASQVLAQIHGIGLGGFM